MAPEQAICSVVGMIVDEFIKNPSYAALTLDQALHEGEHISENSLFIPNIKQFVTEVPSPILQRGAESGVFKSPLNPEIIFWIIFNLASASFLNQR
jgi:TetR/AcrR family transcriptional regulator